jgi:hypothetical protein
VVELGNTAKLIVDSVNNQAKNLYIEVASLTAGIKEFKNNLGRLIPTFFKNKIKKEV